MSEQVEKEGHEPELNLSVAKPSKQNKGKILNRVFAVVLCLAGFIVISTLAHQTPITWGVVLIPTRGHEIVLVFGVVCVCIAIWRGINVARGVLVNVIVTAVILASFQMQLLSPGNAPFTLLAFVVVNGFLKKT